MRAERFPTRRKSKLSPRGDGPFNVLKKFNDNTYQIELPGEFNVSSTFNVSDLSPFDADEAILRSESFQGGGNDEDIQPVQEAIQQVPTMRHPPRTRSGTMALRESFNQGVEALLNAMELEDNVGEHPKSMFAYLKLDSSGDHSAAQEELPLLPIHKELTIFNIQPPSEAAQVAP